MLHRILAVLTAVVLVTATASSPASAARFADVPDTHPFADEIAWLASSRITTGYPDGTFRPGESVLREQMAVFLWRQAGEPAVSDLPARSPFVDVPTSHAFYTAIVWLADAGISTGYADGTFRPSQPVLREQMAAFLYRLRALEATPSAGSGSFVDVPRSSVFRAQIEWLSQSGITTGYRDRTFRPSQPVLREQMAAFLYRYADAFGAGDGAPPGPFTSVPTPTIAGSATVGSRLHGVAGVWTPQPTDVTVQWLRNGVPIAGATSLGYTVRQGDLGATLSFRATASRPGAAVSTRTSSASAPVTAAVLDIVTQRILDDTNRYRAANGRAPLQASAPLSQVAQTWAQQMASTCVFAHNPSVGQQIPAGWRSWGENIAQGQQYVDVVQAWIDSPGHRANLLGDFTHLGIGYGESSPCGKPRNYVQVFARY